MNFASIAEIKVYEASGSECDMYVLRWLLHVLVLLFLGGKSLPQQVIAFQSYLHSTPLFVPRKDRVRVSLF